ncbi:hypothetical protein CTAYLR_003156 [Chrysophaeum taylorii]|uniref:Methyltransferase domain-containing protein n=1 Tax=Chrysophaeum taylorii TaxID=2483200 RepID=A0AAD7UQ24_9STRA|nr:hypothetical protein CTAYLR_003156 [Chrysophaeum taylorii]
MKLWEMEALLSGLEGFDNPKIDLEQYPTSAHLASRVVDAAREDIEDLEVVDLGCGTGMLAAAALAIGAAHVVGVDVDHEALAIAQRNVAADFVLGDVRSLGFRPKSFDACVMNPPFGTRTRGIDVVFLRTAVTLARRAVYSLHKTSTRDYLVGTAARDLGVSVEVIAKIRFDIPRLYKFHTQDSSDVEVDLLRFDPLQSPPCPLRRKRRDVARKERESKN